MNRLKRLLRQPESQVAALFLGFVGISWPLLSVCEGCQPRSMVSYVFAIWAILILLLFFMSRSIGTGGNDGKKEGGRGPDD